ncbi:hypothetical protein Pfo_031439 [Paulownia fortunei]|nr:hypothetical protein Pfo_031439 [Paulownia fortunei]
MGDEGKGKIVDFFAEHADAVVRYQGQLAVLGNGVVVNPEALLAEIKEVESQGITIENLHYDDIYQTYVEYGRQLAPYVTDTSYLLGQLMKAGKRVVFEGAQGVMLDVDHELFDDIADHIREVGHEYGVITKRPRRIGWLDAVALRHAVQVSGLTKLAINSLDVLSGLKELKIATSYTYKGEEIHHFQLQILGLWIGHQLRNLARLDEDITGVTTFEELPVNAQHYLQRISELLEVDLLSFAVGPTPEQTHLWNLWVGYSVAIPWLNEKGYDVIAVVLDVGQHGKDMDMIQAKALQVGATQSIVIDAKSEFAEQYVAPAPEDAYALTQAIENTPDVPEFIDVTFEQGVPVALNGEQLPLAELMLQSMKLLPLIEQQLANLVYEAKWVSPLFDSLMAFVDDTQKNVNGVVKMKLYKGNAIAVARQSEKNSLYNEDLATYTAASSFDKKLLLASSSCGR